MGVFTQPMLMNGSMDATMPAVGLAGVMGALSASDNSDDGFKPTFSGGSNTSMPEPPDDDNLFEKIARAYKEGQLNDKQARQAINKAIKQVEGDSSSRVKYTERPRIGANKTMNKNVGDDIANAMRNRNTQGGPVERSGGTSPAKKGSTDLMTQLKEGKITGEEFMKRITNSEVLEAEPYPKTIKSGPEIIEAEFSNVKPKQAGQPSIEQKFKMPTTEQPSIEQKFKLPTAEQMYKNGSEASPKMTFKPTPEVSTPKPSVDTGVGTEVPPPKNSPLDLKTLAKYGGGAAGLGALLWASMSGSGNKSDSGEKDNYGRPLM